MLHTSTIIPALVGLNIKAAQLVLGGIDSSAFQAHLSTLTPGLHDARHHSSLAYEEVVAIPDREPIALYHQPPVNERKAATATVPSSGVQQEFSAAHTAIILHGLLGSSRNWRSWAKQLAKRAAQQQQHPWRLLLLDVRCHGGSSRLPRIHPPHNMETAANDVLNFIQLRLGQAPRAIIGHSMGGKVALATIQNLLETGADSSWAPQQTWVLDSQPGPVTHREDALTGVATVLDIVHETPLPIPTRQWLQEHLQAKGLSPSIVQWLGSNLVPDSHGKFTWSFDPQGASALYHSYRVSDYWHLLEQPPWGRQLHLVRGELSDRWPAAMLAQLHAAEDKANKFQNSSSSLSNAGTGTFHHHVLPKAGHWLQADNPTGLLDIMLQRLVA